MIDEIIKIGMLAGEAIEEVARNSFHVTIKEDKSPVTEADMASHNLIVKHLEEKFPHIPILSEENCGAPAMERQSWKEYFLVDPLDGTKEFIKRNGHYSVLISLIRDNRPVLGLIHAPVSKETWYAQKGQGAFKILPTGETIPLQVSKYTGGAVNVAVSASHITKKTLKYMEDNFEKYETFPIGSAIKFCRIAEGSVDVYPRLGPTSEWDTSAGEIILQESGGNIIQFEDSHKKNLLEYNKDSLINPYFIAYGTELEKLN